MDLRDLKPEDMNLAVWRYMPFSKFVSLLVYQALWFSKLNILEDEFEGMMPLATKDMMQEDDQEMKKHFPPEQHWQFDQMASRNEQDSRELCIVNCWFLGQNESQCMWDEYGQGTEAIAIKSTVQQLIDNIAVPHKDNVTQFGRVKYVDHKTHMMSMYDASQGGERAFLKDAARFGHENEIRILTLNFKTMSCVSPEGVPYKESEVRGKHMNNFENPGLYIAARLEQLISEIYVSPKAEKWFHLLVKRIVELNKWEIGVKCSGLS